MAGRGSSGRRRSRAVLAGVGLSALAVLVIVLVFVALTQHRSVPEAGSTPGATPPATESTAPANSAPATDVPVTVPVPTRVLAALDEASAVRAVSTACPAPSTIEVTSDSGASWEAAEAGAVAAVQRVVVDADAFVVLIGLGVEGCAPAYERSFTGGTAWESAPDELGASWFIDPANRTGIHTPAGDVAIPCSVAVQVAVTDEASAGLLCDDGSVHATFDSGTSWVSSTPVAGAAAIGFGGDGYRVAVVNQNGCVGAQVVSVTVVDGAAQVGSPGACLEVNVPAGEVAVDSGGDGSIWVWAGDRIGRSADGGISWL